MALVQVTDPAFPGAKSVDFIGQMIVYVEPMGRFWGWSGLTDALAYNALDVAQAETSPDRIVGLCVSNNEVLIFGERTIEPWAFSPTATATFQLRAGSVIESGCGATASIKRIDNSVMYLTNNGQVARLEGYTPRVVSTMAIEADIKDRDWSKAFAYTWEDNGHCVYYLTSPDGHTWGYDVRQGKWHRRESYGLNRWRVNCLIKSGGKWFAGDFQNGRLWEIEWGNTYEGCEIMPRQLCTGVLHASGNKIRINSMRVIAATGLPSQVGGGVAADLAPYRWLGTGQTSAGTRASVRPLSSGMQWVGSSDSEASGTNTTSVRAIVHYGDKMFAIINNSTCRVASVSNITSWSDGPTGIVLGDPPLGHASVFGGRLWVACGPEGLAYLESPDAAAFTTLTNILSGMGGVPPRVEAVTGYDDNVLCMDNYGAFYRSTDAGASWTDGADMFGSGNRFYTSYGALDSNGTRSVAAGGESGIRAMYTDDLGATFTECVLPTTTGQLPNQVRYCGDDRWLIACRESETTSDGLFKSLDNGETFTAVTLPAALQFDLQSKQNIAVDPETGRVVIAGTVVGPGTRKYYYSDDLIAWAEISTDGTNVGGIAEVYHDLPVAPADACTPMEGGVFQVRYSDDGAQNWSNWRNMEAPRTGEFMQNMDMHRLGQTRHRVWEFLDTTDRAQDVLAASLKAQ